MEKYALLRNAVLLYFSIHVSFISKYILDKFLLFILQFVSQSPTTKYLHHNNQQQQHLITVTCKTVYRGPQHRHSYDPCSFATVKGPIYRPSVNTLLQWISLSSRRLPLWRIKVRQLSPLRHSGVQVTYRPLGSICWSLDCKIRHSFERAARHGHRLRIKNLLKIRSVIQFKKKGFIKQIYIF